MIERMEESSWPTICTKFMVGDILVKELSRKTWSELIRSDL